MLKRNLTLKKRFITYFIILIVLPIFLLMSLIFERYYSALFDTRLRESENLIRSYGESIEEEIKTMSLKTSAIAFNRDFQMLAESYFISEDPGETHSYRNALDNILNLYFDYSDDIISLCLYFKGDRTFVYKNPLPQAPGLLKKEAWFNKLLNDKNRVIILNDLTYQRTAETPEYRFGAVISPDLGTGTSILGILVLYQSRMLNSIAGNKSETGMISIADSSGVTLFTAGQLKDKDKTIVRRHSIGKTGWSLENHMSLREIRKPVSNSFIVITIFLIAITALFVLFAISQFRLIIGPINHSIHNMAEVEKGDFTVSLPSSPISELNRMAISFNRMVTEIEKLTKEIREKEQEKRKVEIQAMQYQINPHFLSNTLNSIKIMARMIEADKIRETTTSLMRILSDTFRNPDPHNTLEHEFQILNEYVRIMKVRYGDSFSVKFRLSEGIKKKLILKLLLQPIVENAVVHGLREKETGGRLFIGASISDNKLVVSIIDNGEGMEKFPVKQEPEEVKGTGMYHIGLRNVTNRIVLNYGKPYGVKITGRKNFFTKVTLILPLIGEVDV